MSDRTTLPRVDASDFSTPGWYWSGMSVQLRCPGCLSIGRLDDHEIADDGTVEPSVDCPQCDFHEWIVLEGWADAS